MIKNNAPMIEKCKTDKLYEPSLKTKMGYASFKIPEE
jgi:hypothetical protein